jgi:hypothetical protein
VGRILASDRKSPAQNPAVSVGQKTEPLSVEIFHGILWEVCLCIYIYIDIDIININIYIY